MKHVWEWIKDVFGYIFRYALRVIITIAVIALMLFLLDRFGVL